MHARKKGSPRLITGATISVGSSKCFNWLRNEAFSVSLGFNKEGTGVRPLISLSTVGVWEDFFTGGSLHRNCQFIQGRRGRGKCRSFVCHPRCFGMFMENTQRLSRMLRSSSMSCMLYRVFKDTIYSQAWLAHML